MKGGGGCGLCGSRLLRGCGLLGGPRLLRGRGGRLSGVGLVRGGCGGSRAGRRSAFNGTTTLRNAASSKSID
ncbi:hypothetical protein ACFVWS_20115, partial [Streptomyces sp. NPDC058204]|uniref:hypothetical protein n=1 Tax=Streptomyces sp. NPDC058204 TaxID=3346381 RepID=UPI0036ECDE86